MIRCRSLVLWLLMLVLPWQGMAVSAMTLCGPAGAGAEAHHQPAAGVQASAHDHHGHHGHEAVALDPASPALTSDQLHAEATAAHLLQACCGAACTMAFAITAAPCGADQAKPPTPRQAVVGLHPSVVLDGLDRPPQV